MIDPGLNLTGKKQTYPDQLVERWLALHGVIPRRIKLIRVCEVILPRNLQRRQVSTAAEMNIDDLTQPRVCQDSQARRPARYFLLRLLNCFRILCAQCKHLTDWCFHSALIHRAITLSFGRRTDGPGQGWHGRCRWTIDPGTFAMAYAR